MSLVCSTALTPAPGGLAEVETSGCTQRAALVGKAVQARRKHVSMDGASCPAWEGGRLAQRVRGRKKSLTWSELLLSVARKMSGWGWTWVHGTGPRAEERALRTLRELWMSAPAKRLLDTMWPGEADSMVCFCLSSLAGALHRPAVTWGFVLSGKGTGPLPVV